MDDRDCDCCCEEPKTAFRPVLWLALAINLAMFVVEVGAGFVAGSSALQADALDFLGDAANYAVSLAVFGLAVAWRARAALLKSWCMGLFGLWIVGNILWHSVAGTVPNAAPMGVIGVVALAANAAVASMLYRFRAGDANMRSVWICARNDVIGNIAVLLAALGVFGTGDRWPDSLVALVMASLALSGAWKVRRHAIAELGIAAS